MIRINPPELLARYPAERKALALAMLTHNAIAAMAAGLLTHTPYPFLFALPILWSVLWTFLPLRRIVLLREEEKLAEQNRMEGFAISDTGISCNIALLDGPIRRRLRENGQGIYHADWKDIRYFTVTPERVIRSHEPQYRRMKHVLPGLYILTLASGEDVRILRTLLAGHEADILNFIGTHTSVPVGRHAKLG